MTPDPYEAAADAALAALRQPIRDALDALTPAGRDQVAHAARARLMAVARDAKLATPEERRGYLATSWAALVPRARALTAAPATVCTAIAEHAQADAAYALQRHRFSLQCDEGHWHPWPNARPSRRTACPNL